MPTEFISANELMRRVSAWDDAHVARTFLDNLSHGFRAVGAGFTAWQGFNGYHWAPIS